MIALSNGEPARRSRKAAGTINHRRNILAKQIGPLATREAIATIIRACHRTYKGSRHGDEMLHSGEYEAAEKILDTLFHDGKG